jgi:hypothetical protein
MNVVTGSVTGLESLTVAGPNFVSEIAAEAGGVSVDSPVTEEPNVVEAPTTSLLERTKALLTAASTNPLAPSVLTIVDSGWEKGGLERLYFAHDVDPDISGLVEIDTTDERCESARMELLVPPTVADLIIRFVLALPRIVKSAEPSALPIEAGPTAPALRVIHTKESPADVEGEEEDLPPAVDFDALSLRPDEAKPAPLGDTTLESYPQHLNDEESNLVL